MEPASQRFMSIGMKLMLHSIHEKASLLEKSDFGKELSWPELQTLAGYFSVWEVPAAVCLCRQGEQSDFAFLLFKGRVRILKEDTNKVAKEIASVGPGHIVGEMALIDKEPRSASVMVKSPLLIMVIEESKFEEMSETVPRLWGKVLLGLAKILSKRLRQTSGVLAEYISN